MHVRHKKIFIGAILVAVGFFCVLTMQKSSVYADPVVDNSEEVCESPHTMLSYTNMNTLHSWLTVNNPGVIWWGCSVPEQDKIDELGSGTVQVLAVPDNTNNKIHWTLYYNGAGKNWQKPWMFFTLQDNVKLLDNESIKILTFYKNVSEHTMDLKNGLVVMPNNFTHETVKQSTDGVSTLSNGYTCALNARPDWMSNANLFWKWDKNVGDFLVGNQTLRNNITYASEMERYKLKVDEIDKNKLDGNTMGNIFFWQGGDGHSASSGLPYAYTVEFNTTMPEDKSQSISVYAGMKSWQENEVIYGTQRFTLNSRELTKTTYSLQPMRPSTSGGSFIFTDLGPLPKEGLYQSLLDNSPSLKDLSVDQRHLIEWLLYDGYPYDNSKELGNYMMAAKVGLEAYKLNKFIQYGLPPVGLDTYANPIRAYYHITQNAIWAVVTKQYENYPFEKAEFTYDEGTETKVSEYKFAGIHLLNRAKRDLELNGPLSDYLEKKGQSGLVPYLYTKIQDRGHETIEGSFVNLESRCRRNPRNARVTVKNVDKQGNKLSDGTFVLYKGGLTKEQLKNPDSLTSLGTFTSHDGVIDLGILETYQQYTLVQTKAPGELYASAPPRVFEAFPSVKLNTIDPKEIILNKYNDEIDYSDFTRLYAPPSDVFLKAFKLSDTGLLGDEVNSINAPNKILDLGSGKFGYKFEKAFDMVNPKLEFSPGATGKIEIGDKVANLNLETLEGNRLPFNVQYSNFATQPVKATLYYKGLNPNVDYIAVSQLMRVNDDGSFTNVGPMVTTEISSETLKSQLTHELTSDTFNDVQNEINSYSEAKNFTVNFGNTTLKTGTYLVRSSIETKDKYLNARTDFDAQTSSPNDPNSLFADVVVSDVPLTALTLDKNTKSFQALLVVMFTIGTLTSIGFILKRRFGTSSE